MEQRWRFLQEALQGQRVGFAALCRRFGVSRNCGYKWLRRVRQLGRVGLGDLSRRPHRRPGAFAAQWPERVLRVHRLHYGVGARKVRALLRRAHPGVHLPAERTIHRWLRRAGKVRVRAPSGPVQVPRASRAAHRANDVWTIDFKGWFYTQDGRRVQLLTVRDLASRYVLAAVHVPHVDEPSVARALRRLFRRHGLPRSIRVDRGAPFCGDGPRRWSRLSVEWLRCGIAVQITRRARPQDNAAHEQMHRMLKANTATPPARTLRAQQQRVARWRHWYNEQRPHAALGERPPAECYRPSRRPWNGQLLVWHYPSRWPSRPVDRRGYIFWRGQRWQIGRAFYQQHIGLRLRARHCEVYLGPYLLGSLHRDEHLIRPVRLVTSRQGR
jgi:putative transposase